MNLSSINLGTTLVVLVLSHVLTGLLILSYTAKRSMSRAVRVFLLSKLFQTVAWILFGLRDTVPSMAVKAMANVVLFAGAVLELVSLLMLKDRYTKGIQRGYAVLLTVCVILFVAATAGSMAESTRIALASAIAAALMAFPTYVLLADKESSLLQRTIASFYGVTILFLLCRACAAVLTDLDMDLSSTNVFNTGLLLLLYLVMLAGSTGFILLDKEKADLEMLRAASIDDLTNILNRRTFILRSKETISLFARRQEPVSFLLMDIDNFKRINDEHGHYAGDIVLGSFADTIKKLLRDYDLFGRYGGEEFAVLLPGTHRREAAEIAERLRMAVEASCVHAGSQIRYTVSIGVATVIPDRETSVDMLCKMSDHALYAAKTQGKNRIAEAQSQTPI